MDFFRLFQKPSIAKSSSVLKGKIVLITSTALQIGVELLITCILNKAAFVVFGTEGQDKIQEVHTMLMADTRFESTVSETVLRFWEIDMGSYRSVRAFGRRVCVEIGKIDLAVLDSATGILPFERTREPPHNDTTLQRNFLSPAMLSLYLLPLLAQGAEDGLAGRLTFVTCSATKNESIEREVLSWFTQQPECQEDLAEWRKELAEWEQQRAARGCCDSAEFIPREFEEDQRALATEHLRQQFQLATIAKELASLPSLFPNYINRVNERDRFTDKGRHRMSADFLGMWMRELARRPPARSVVINCVDPGPGYYRAMLEMADPSMSRRTCSERLCEWLRGRVVQNGAAAMIAAATAHVYSHGKLYANGLLSDFPTADHIRTAFDFDKKLQAWTAHETLHQSRARDPSVPIPQPFVAAYETFVEKMAEAEEARIRIRFSTEEPLRRSESRFDQLTPRW